MSKAQVLIVDDNELNSEILATLVENSNLELEALRLSLPSKIPAALKAMSNLRVIFLDLELPNYNGYQILEELRANAALASVPIIAYTVHTNQIETIRQAGFDGFLAKPLNPRRFPDQIKRILGGKAVWELD
ncbi:MAG: response regulator [Chloroflexota bacterium]|nr:response regulator [Chloroflexota bacterium]